MGLYRDKEDVLALAPSLKVDVLIQEYATIQPEQIREIGTLLLCFGAERAVVVYGFASRTTLDRLESARIIPIRGPIDRAELRRWCLVLKARRAPAPGLRADAGIDISGPLPAQRFDADALVKIAAASVTVRCECPHHLVDVISSLNAFETYSQECDVLNVDDAALHAFLHSATAQARSLLETALARVMDADAIEIEDEDRRIGTGRTTRVAGQNARRGGVGRIRTRRQTEKRRGAGAGTDTTVMPKQSLPLHNVTRDLS